MRIFFVLMLVLFESAIADDKLVFEEAWVRAAPPSAKILAAYGQLKNRSEKEIRIVSISSDTFKKVEMHLTTLDKGMMHMEKMQIVVLKPNESIIFQPNGRHLMLIKPQVAIRQGSIIPIVMNTQSGESYLFHLAVKR